MTEKNWKDRRSPKKNRKLQKLDDSRMFWGFEKRI